MKWIHLLLTCNFLAEANKAIYDTMHSVDNEAVYVMQGWLFHSGLKLVNVVLILSVCRFLVRHQKNRSIFISCT